jgi:protein-S-isoprenylcysteine O-methyltransferase Ste14
MNNRDYWLCALHAGFWILFAITRLLVRARANATNIVSTAATAAPAAPAPSARTAASARFSRLIFVPHIVAFGLMYSGIDAAVFRHRVPAWLAGQRVLGALIIAAGGALMSWALLYFRSWRFRATLDEGHQLATGGPFRYLRHPIYMALNLLALGTAVWAPTPIILAAAALMIVGSDLRGRAEEGILLSSFGDTYRDYSARTRRFLPGVY